MSIIANFIQTLFVRVIVYVIKFILCYDYLTYFQRTKQVKQVRATHIRCKYDPVS